MSTPPKKTVPAKKAAPRKAAPKKAAPAAKTSPTTLEQRVTALEKAVLTLFKAIELAAAKQSPRPELKQRIIAQLLAEM